MENHGNTVVDIQAFHCHVNPTELVFSQTEIFYSGNIGIKGFGLEGVK
jgi:hypothetical protein